MSVVLNGTSQYLVSPGVVVTGGTPVTIAAWFYSTSSALSQAIGCFDSSTFTQYHLLQASGAIAGDPIRAMTYEGSWKISETTSGYSTGVWTHACGVWAANNDRRAFINGGSKGTDATAANAPPNPYFMVGAYRRTGPLGFFQGNLAEIAVWDVALSDAEVAQLAAGLSPKDIKQNNLIHYWKLSNNAVEHVIGTPNLNAVGAPSYNAGVHPTLSRISGLYDWWDEILDSYLSAYDTRWRAQSFTPSSTFSSESVRLRLHKYGSPGTLIVSLRATDGLGHPTGPDLCSGTINGNALTTELFAGLWYQITWATPYTLISGTKYAIVVRAPSGSVTNSVSWHLSAGSGTYAGGTSQSSLDSGATWSDDSAGYDASFQMFGSAVAPPSITDQSTDTTVNEGGPVNLFVTASGSEPISYQWYKNDVLMPGETSSTLSFTAAKTDQGTYKCIVTNEGGSDTSNPIVLTVNYVPVITGQSGYTVSMVGTLVSLFVTVDAVPAATYQWYKNGVIVPGATSSTYSFYSTYDSAGNYTCIATNVVGGTESGTIVLVVTENVYRYRLYNIPSDLPRESG